MEKVGSGGFGSVWKGQWKSKKMIVAIKTLVDIDEREVRDLRQLYCVEHPSLSQIQHDNSRLVIYSFLDLKMPFCTV